MTNSLDRIRQFVGVDVSQDRLDVCLLPNSAQVGFSRDRRRVCALREESALVDTKIPRHRPGVDNSSLT
jgi:hypothetical protein